jgi:hypothetical protein
MGEAQNLDRPPAFIPNMNIVLLQGSKRLIYVTGKNKTRTVRLIRYPDCLAIFIQLTKWAFYLFVKLNPGSSCEVKKIKLHSYG